MNRIREALRLLKTKSVLVSWGLSYLFILLIPIIFGVYNNIMSRRILISEVERANDIVLESFKNDVDGTLESLRYTATTILADERFHAVSGSNESNRLWLSYQCASFFNIHRASNPDLSVLLYMEDGDHLVTHQTANSYTMLHEALPGEKRASLSSGQWMALLSQNKKSEYTISPYLTYTNFGRDLFTYQNNISVYKSATNEKSNVNLFVSLPCDSLSVLSADARYIIVGEDGTRLWGWNSNDIISTADFFLPEKDGGVLHFTSGGVEYMCDYAPSDEAPWYYLVITPMAQMHQQTALVMKNLAITTIVSMIIGIGLMIWFVSRNYMPLSEIMSAMNAADISAKGNEFTIIKEAYTALETENSSIKDTLLSQRESIKEKYLLSLLVGRVDKKADSEVARNIHEMYGTKPITIVSVRFAADKELQRSLYESQSMYYDIMSFAVDNVFAELLENGYEYSRVHDGDYMVYIFADGNGALSISSDAGTERLSVLHDFFESKFGIDMTLVVSEQALGVDQLATSYREILETFDYAQDAGETGIIHTKNLKSVFDYSRPQKDLLERRMRMAVENGDHEAALSAAAELMAQISEATTLTGKPALNLLFTVLDRAMDSFLAAFPFDVDVLDRLREKISLLGEIENKNVLEKEILDIIRYICSYISMYSGEKNSELALQVMQYVDENYKDSNLNITAIANALEISPKTVSHHFRRATSLGVLDYINHVRISNAKQIAARQSVSIERLSQMVGYTSVKTFRRAFSKEEGITPGKFFRSMHNP
ncbi:MAG: helix-turn-helix transcriptional regulator [Christensenellales bacterium]|jgi:two-component system response regulator YesN